MKSFGVGESVGQELLLLTVPETARLLRIGRNTVYELVARGELPAVRLGRVIRIPRHRLLAWIDAQSKDGQGRLTERVGRVVPLSPQRH